MSTVRPACTPQAQAFIESLFASGALPVSAGTVARARAVTDSLVPPLEDADAERVKAIVIPGDPDIPALAIRPASEPRALMVYFHGGGWVIGSPKNYVPFAIQLADSTGCTILLPQYRLAPEARFPAAAQDAIHATRWIADAGRAALGENGPLIIGGDSAGGNLAAVATQQLSHSVRIACQVLIYPVVDCVLTRESYRRHAAGSMLSAADMTWFWDQYAPESDERLDPMASPLRATRLEGLPPTLIVAAEIDPLLDEGQEYRHRLESSGVPVSYRLFPRVPHGFVPMIGAIDESSAAIRFISEEINKHIDNARSDP